jgi:DNA polymerase III delta subunit
VDFAQLKGTLKGQTAPVYLLFGNDLFLLNKSVELITNAVSGNTADMSACADTNASVVSVSAEVEVIKFDDETAPDAVVFAAQTPSFFGGKRIIVYKIADKISPQNINTYIKSPSADTVLIIMGYADKNSYGIHGATEVNCNPMPTAIISRQIASQIAPKRITKNAAEFLCDAAGSNYAVINNELNKIVNYFTDIELLDTEHINKFIAKTADYEIYELGAAILSNRLADARKMIEYLDITGYEVFGGLVARFRRVYYAAATKCGTENVAKAVGGSAGAVYYSRRDFGGRGAEVAAKYRQSLELEYKIKSGQISIENAVFSLLFRPN